MNTLARPTNKLGASTIGPDGELSGFLGIVFKGEKERRRDAAKQYLLLQGVAESAVDGGDWDRRKYKKYEDFETLVRAYGQPAVNLINRTGHVTLADLEGNYEQRYPVGNLHSRSGNYGDGKVTGQEVVQTGTQVVGIVDQLLGQAREVKSLITGEDTRATQQPPQQTGIAKEDLVRYGLYGATALGAGYLVYSAVKKDK